MTVRNGPWRAKTPNSESNESNTVAADTSPDDLFEATRLCFPTMPHESHESSHGKWSPATRERRVFKETTALGQTAAEQRRQTATALSALSHAQGLMGPICLDYTQGKERLKTENACQLYGSPVET
ncbi:hypothetical protein E4U47_002721 [Claviceps purpurea]|nr:hypothetical protein E4U10_004959 [Claviceps purpurea]KAG6255030.1 hypothetical protein E4U23_005125 [Claviceps purpurea]KAG6279701.1 hypothetical protein E4U47_002721 [Claviceps purpurea]KAG6313081.1 hypothetical protein E4U44_002832 [Claviceps purpurea]